MNRKSLLIISIVMLQIWIKNTEAATVTEGRSRDRGSGKEGKYVPDENKWKYKPDNSGKYVHVHIPYDGGYGPFKDPYAHDAIPAEPYKHDDRKYDDVFTKNSYDDKPPKIRLEYGSPSFKSFSS